MRFDANKVEANAKKATTEDLLDRVTVYREGMEAEALPILEAELRARGVNGDAVHAHEQRRRLAGTTTAEGFAAKCSQCFRPAVARVRHWHRLWGWIPVFPVYDYFCEAHLPRK